MAATPSRADDEESPVPWGPVLVVLACIFVDALQMMLVYPFLPFLVADLLGPGRSADVAAHAGLLAGAYKLGQFVCAPAYGYAADALGRRPTILVSLAAGPVALVLFGTAQSLRAALAWRLAQGLASAAGTVGKASLADLTDSTNEARVFSYTGLSMALGVIVGPVLGGVLARPCHSPLAGDASGTGLCALEPQPGLLRRYAYLAPCAVAAALTLCTLIAACVLLPETRPTVQARPGGAAGRGAAAGGDSNASPLLASAPAAIDGAASKGTAAAPAPELWRAFAVVQATQVSFKLKINGFAEVLPVRMAAAPEQGGSALGARTIGLSQAFGGIVLVGVVLVAFPRCVRAAGLAGTLRAGLAAQVCLFAIPLALDAARAAISRLGGVLAPGGGSLAVGAYAAAWAVRAFALNVANPATALLSKACLPADRTGFSLGVNQAASSLGNALGPVVSGWFYTRVLTLVLPDCLAKGRLYFVVGGGAALLTYALAWVLPAGLGLGEKRIRESASRDE